MIGWTFRHMYQVAYKLGYTTRSYPFQGRDPQQTHYNPRKRNSITVNIMNTSSKHDIVRLYISKFQINIT